LLTLRVNGFVLSITSAHWLGLTYRKLFAVYNRVPCESLDFDFGYPDHFGPFFNFL
jgi:hypothetical protein